MHGPMPFANVLSLPKLWRSSLPYLDVTVDVCVCSSVLCVLVQEAAAAPPLQPWLAV